MTRDVNRPAGERREQRDVRGRLVGPPLRGRVVGGADRDEHRADVLVPQVELDLLERPLHEKRGVGVDDGSHPLERETGGDADQELLADADVDHTVGVARNRARLLEAGHADVGQHDGEP